MYENTTEDPSLETLFDQNLQNFINAIAFRFYNTYGRGKSNSSMISQEDLANEGCLGATTAYRSFDPSLGYTDNIFQSFRTHAYPYIKNAMLTYCRKFGHSLSISEKAARDELGLLINIGVVHIDQFGDDEEFDIPAGSGIDVSQDVDEYFLAGFTELECILIKDYMIDGYSLQELSDRHNISKSRAGEIIRGLTARMQTRAEDYAKND
jgi:RNA polymerase sigma factor (sigma-70 family)